MKTPLSVIVPTRNEAAHLADCLRHLQWADEVIVLDSSSTDSTREIACAHGATVINFMWNGRWPKKKNWAIKSAPIKHEWILFVDADEWITPELATEVDAAIRQPGHVAYYINRRWMFMGRWLKHGGWYPSWNVRLIKRGCGEFERLTQVEDTGSGDNEVHEHLVPTGSIGRLKNDMIHMAFGTIDSFIEKHNRYSNWEAAVQFRATQEKTGPSGNSNLLMRRRLKSLSRRLPFRPTLRFLYMYLLKLGFLDGQAGFTIARLVAIYEYLSVAKFKELQWRAKYEQASK